METVSVAEAKQGLSDLLGRVFLRGETILITRRGKPVAHLGPVPKRDRGPFRGFVKDGDPFLAAMEDIVAKRHSSVARVLRKRTRRAA